MYICIFAKLVWNNKAVVSVKARDMWVQEWSKGSNILPH